MTTHNRFHRGVPEGGRFTTGAKGESDVALTDASPPVWESPHPAIDILEAGAQTTMSEEPLTVAAATYEKHTWVADNDGMRSRAAMARSSGDYT